MQLYHGSPNKFKKFDTSRLRTNGSLEGLGFYFTTSIDIAMGYAQNGYLYTAELDCKKGLSDNKRTMTRHELKVLLIELDKRTNYLSNYGDIQFETYNVILDRALTSEYDYNDTDTEIIGSIYNSDGENHEILTLIYEMLGYDHIKSTPSWGLQYNQSIIIALTNDIISIKRVEKVL